MMSAPQSMARSASARVCSWQNSGMPAALTRLANGSGSSNDRKIALGLRAIAASRSSGRLRSDQVMNPQPTAWLPAAANSRSNQPASSA